MVLMLIISTIIAMVIVLFEFNWIVEYLIELCLKITHALVTTDTINILIVFIIENIFLVNEIERNINNKQKTRKNSRLQWIIITTEQLSCNINCNTTNKD